MNSLEYTQNKIQPVKQRFKLSSSTVEELQGRKPEFGFNGLGELVFRRTYSRGGEDWVDVVQRVVEGCLSIRKEHFHRNSLRWVDEEWQSFAREMAHSLFSMEWLPPGRGLWMMGTDFTYERGSFALNNCFRRDTAFWTDQGLKTFEDFKDGDKVMVRGKNKWCKATVTSFGQQQLWKLTVSKGPAQRIIYTTANHRWLAKTKKDDGKYTFKVKTTTELEKNWKLQSFAKRTNFHDMEMCPVGIQHGIVFGDGTKHPVGHCNITLCGEKTELSRYFFTPRRENATITGLPNTWKDLPPLSMNKEYLLGFLSGWVAVDGCLNKSLTLTNKDKEVLQWARDAFFKLDILTSQVQLSRTHNPFDGSYSPLYKITIYRDVIPEKFFIRDKHIQDERKVAKKYIEWRVVDVEPTEEFEEVWCVVEPEHEEFTLENGILTKNCAATDTAEDLVLSAEWTMDGLMNGCVPPGTLINTEHGIRKIEDIQVGDRVWTQNMQRTHGSAELKKVLFLHDPVILRENNLRITTKYGSFTTSKNHYIMVKERGKWIYKLGKDIQTGDILNVMTNAGCARPDIFGRIGDTVLSTEENLDLDEHWKDLTVEDNHNYFCGDPDTEFVSFYGVKNCGVGFTTNWRGEAKMPDKEDREVFIIPDSREGWVQSLVKLMCAYVHSPRYGTNKFPEFDYSQIRDKGAPIRGFGGTASGPDPLRQLHERVESYLDAFCNRRLQCTSKTWKEFKDEGDSGKSEWKEVDVEVDKPYSHTRLVADIFNAIGACVVAGNV